MPLFPDNVLHYNPKWQGGRHNFQLSETGAISPDQKNVCENKLFAFVECTVICIFRAVQIFHNYF